MRLIGSRSTSTFSSTASKPTSRVAREFHALNSDAWQYQIPDLLDAGVRCITYDRRGHGRSDRFRTMAGYAVDFTDELRDFDVPTLVVHGDADASAPLEHTGARVAALVPHGELVVLPGAGHGLYASDHEVVNEWLVKFLCHN